jgi:hypothetical protein
MFPSRRKRGGYRTLCLGSAPYGNGWCAQNAHSPGQGHTIPNSKPVWWGETAHLNSKDTRLAYLKSSFESSVVYNALHQRAVVWIKPMSWAT